MTSNQAYSDAAIAGELNKLRNAGTGATNDTLIAVACRMYEFVNAGALPEADADQRLTAIARSRGHAEQSIKATLKSAKRRTRGQAATLPAPSSRSIHELSLEPTPKTYSGLAAYEHERGAPGAYAAAGWKAVQHHGRPALRFADETGMPRWRYLDGQTPKYWHANGHHTDTNKQWYRLAEACAIAHARPQPLVLCNGESSVVAAQAHGIAATCITGGGERALPQRLLDELLAAWPGAFLVALDCDAKGRKAAPELAQQLCAAGRQARAVDLQLRDKQDLADFCAVRNGRSIEDLASCADLVITATPATGSSIGSATPANQPPFTVRGEAALDEMPPVRYLSRELGIVAGMFHLIYGASGSGKTFFAIERALRLMSEGYTVIYVPTEDVQGLRYRRAAWRLAHPGATGELLWLEMPQGLDLQNAQQVDELLAALRPHQPDFVVLDTLREAHSGDENSSQDGARVNHAVQRMIRELGVAVDVVHHSGVAGERPRGTTALFANCDVVLKVDNDDGVARVSFEKTRGLGGAPREPLNFAFLPQDSGLTDTDGQSVVSAILRPTTEVTRRATKITPSERKVLEALDLSIFADAGAKERQIVLTAQLSERSTYRALSNLKDRGYIVQSAKGDPYFITPEGRAAIAPAYVTATQHSPSASATATTATELPTPANGSAVTPTELPATATTLRGGSAGSWETVAEELAEDIQESTHSSGNPWSDNPDQLMVGSSRLQELTDTGLSRADAQKQAITEARRPTEQLTAAVTHPHVYDPVAACTEALDRRSWLDARTHLSNVPDGPERDRLLVRYQEVKASWGKKAMMTDNGLLFEMIT